MISSSRSMSFPACAEPATPDSTAAGLAAPDGAGSVLTVEPTRPHPLAPLLNAVNDLASIGDVDDLARSAVVLARDRIGLERGVLFSRDAAAWVVRLRGSWSIAASGEVVEARSLLHECSVAEHAALLHLHQHGQLWRH